MITPTDTENLRTLNLASNDTAQDIELIFLGTGTSSSLPHIECLTAPPEIPPCNTCLSALTPEGRKNARRNTSAVIRLKDSDGSSRTIVIDVGKTFLPAALEWFPKYGLRKIDAVLITHAHADAMNGLDDLRGWTLNGNIQHHIDLYASNSTFREVQRAFPYLVSKEFASGGGDVPEFRWHIIEDRVPFKCAGLEITPFNVHHGRVFSQTPFLNQLPSPNITEPSTPISGRSSPLPHIITINDESPATTLTRQASRVPTPYLCMGYKIQDSLVYISDVSFIPEDVWGLLESSASSIPRPPAVFILDCLRMKPHTSHFGLKQAMEAVRRLKAQRSYFVGFTHDLTHDQYTDILCAVGEGKRMKERSVEPAYIRDAFDLVGEGEPRFVRPAYDGLRLSITVDGRISESYI